MNIELSNLSLAPMQLADLEQVLAVDQAVHLYPWTKGNFIDSLTHGHDAWVVRSNEHVLLGYFVQVMVLDEGQLLTIGVSKEWQGQGIGLYLLRYAVECARLMGANAMTLEVRASNQRALRMYEGYGFEAVGRRKNYYQTNSGQREDALILRYSIGTQHVFK